MHDLLCSHVSQHSRIKAGFTHNWHYFWADMANGRRTNGRGTFFASLTGISPRSIQVAVKSLDHRLVSSKDAPVLDREQCVQSVFLLHKARWYTDADLNFAKRLKDCQFIRYSNRFGRYAVPLVHAKPQAGSAIVRLTRNLLQTDYWKAKLGALDLEVTGIAWHADEHCASQGLSILDSSGDMQDFALTATSTQNLATSSNILGIDHISSRVLHVHSCGRPEILHESHSKDRGPQNRLSIYYPFAFEAVEDVSTPWEQVKDNAQQNSTQDADAEDAPPRYPIIDEPMESGLFTIKKYLKYALPSIQHRTY
jgi:hypothetical protein